MRRQLITTTAALIALCVSGPLVQLAADESPRLQPPASQTTKAPAASELDQLLAPVALFPDQLLAQMLLCAGNPGKVGALDEWLASQSLKGSELQDAAARAGFDPSFVALAVFPDVVNRMASQIDWTARLGSAFAADRTAVFASIQRLRQKAQGAGKLKDTPQQDVATKTTSSGEQVIVIEPANPQVVYVPQYNPQTVYTQSTSSTVVVQESSSSDAVAAGLIGFTAGVAIGAAFDNDYYYGPYGWGGGAYMYNDAWDDWYDHREDAREDWADHREDLYEERGEQRENLAEERGERSRTAQEQRTERQQNTQQQRTERQQTRQETPRSAQAQATASEARSTARSSAESRGYSTTGGKTAERSGTRSDAFSGYSSGRSEGAASQRGQRSRSSSRSSGGRRR